MSLEDSQPQSEKSSQLPVDLKDQSGSVTLMKLTPELDPDGLINRLDMEKLSSNENLSRVLGSIPSVASAIALNQSFRIVMPAGVAGSLMRLVKDPAMSGLLTTSVVGNSGKVIATAGLASMSAFVAPMIVWTILSFITGQFFLTQIQRNTQAIFEELRNILFFLVAQEESDLRARIEFLRYVSINFSALCENSEMRISTLTNLQKTNIESLASLKLWVYNIEKEIDDMTKAISLVQENRDRKANITKVANLVGETRRHINRAVASWQCYALGIAMEIQLGSIFELSLLNYTKKNLLQQSDDLKSSLAKVGNIWNSLNNISYFNESPIFRAGEINEVCGEVIEFTSKIDTAITSTEQYINTLETIENKGINLLYYNNCFYRPSKNALSPSN